MVSTVVSEIALGDCLPLGLPIYKLPSMHPSSLDNMKKCRDRFLVSAFFDERSAVRVLDVGGADLNGSYRPLFSDRPYEYVSADMEPGPGVDLVLQAPYELPYEDSEIDVVISGQMLEHCEFFWLAFQEMVRVVKPNGFIFLIAPSGGPIHRFPVDCYRFLPDAYEALAKYTNCRLIDVWQDKRRPWHDLVGVFGYKQL